jgi:hypothetical protein
MAAEVAKLIPIAKGLIKSQLTVSCQRAASTRGDNSIERFPIGPGCNHGDH